MHSELLLQIDSLLKVSRVAYSRDFGSARSPLSGFGGSILLMRRSMRT
jgi:hypothetical protein